MKRFLGFVIKEFYHIFRDYRTLLILFGMPAAQLLLFGYVITNEIRNARIAIYDQSRDEVTRKLSEKIISSGYFILQENLTSYDQIGETFRKGRTNIVIVFEPDFEENLSRTGKASMQIIGDASDPNTANILVSYVSGIVTNYLIANNLSKTGYQIAPEVRMQYNPELKGVFMFVPGIMAMLLMLISALMTSLSITREKELGTMELLLVSPLRPIQIIIGKVIPYVLLAFTDSVIIILMGRFVFGVPVMGSYVLLLAESFLYIIMALSLGILISAVTKTQQIAMMISLVALMLPTILLSGFIFPIDNMPLILQVLCRIIPPTYFIIIIKGIMLKGNDLFYLWKETLVLVGFIIIFIIISIKKFRIRLEKS